MKKIVSIIIFLFVAHLASAQDYLVKRNGEEFYCKVKEINTTEIIYTDTISSNVLRVINKSDVLFIKYQNGFKEVFNQDEKKEDKAVNNVPINPATGLKIEGPIIDVGGNDYSVNGRLYNFRQVRKLMLNLDDPEINRLLTVARLSTVFGNVLAYTSIPVGYAGFALGVNSVNNNGDAAFAVAGITLGALCLSSNAANIVFKINKRKKIQEAIAIYNKRVEEFSQNR